MKTRELSGELLNYWVALALNHLVEMRPEGCFVIDWDKPGSLLTKSRFDPLSTDSDLLIAIIEDAKICPHWTGRGGGWNACIPSHSKNHPEHETWAGCVYSFGTYREATLKCRVAYAFGDDVSELSEVEMGSANLIL
jgi:hypothetical protein